MSNYHVTIKRGGLTNLWVVKSIFFIIAQVWLTNHMY